MEEPMNILTLAQIKAKLPSKVDRINFAREQGK